MSTVQLSAEEYAKFTAAFQANVDGHYTHLRFGPFQMPAYSAVKVIADAIAGSKSTDPTKVAAYIHANSFKTPIGNVEYDKKGDLKAFNFVVFTWHKDATKTEAK